MQKHPVRKHLVWLIIAAWVYTFTFIFNNYWSKYASYDSVTKSFQKSVTERERQFEEWVQDSTFLLKLVDSVESVNAISKLKEQPFHVFLFGEGDTTDVPVFWSTNAVLPDSYHINFYPTGSFVKYGNGQYELLKRNVKLHNKPYVVVGLLQLHEEFFIENGSLRREYPGFPGLGGKMSLTTSLTAYPLVGENGKPIIYFEPQVDEPIYVFNFASFLIEFVACIFLFLFISKLSQDLVARNLPGGLIIFLAIVCLLRWAVGKYGIPIAVNQFPLLSEGSLLNVQSADELKRFILNAVFGLWVGSFLTRNTALILQFLGGLGRELKWLVIIVCAVVVAGGHFFLAYMVRDLYLNSAVAFDLTNFFSFNYTTILSFLVIFLLCVNHYMVLRFAVLVFMRLSTTRNWVILTLLSFAGLVLLSLLPDRTLVFPLLVSLIWLLLFFTAGFTRLIKPAPTSSGIVVAWLFIYSFSLSLFLGMLSDSRLETKTSNISRSLLLQKDETSEYLVRIAAASVKRIDWLQLLNECKSERDCRMQKDSIISAHFSGYLDRYKTSLYFFDRDKAGVYNGRDISYESLNTLFSTQGTPIDNSNLAFFGESFDQFGYVIKQEIRNKLNGVLEGHLFVLIRSLRSSNQAFAPELFRQLQNFAINLPPDYSYAWYKNGTLVEQYRNYPFQTTLPPAMVGNQSMWEHKTGDTYELWTSAGGDTVLALAAQRNVFISFISMLAYLFGAFLIFYFILAMSALVIKGKLFSGEAFDKINLNLQTKIRLTVIAILMISFIIVAVVTISFFISQFKSENTEKLAKTVQTVSAEITRNIPANYDTLSRDAQLTVLQRLLFSITKGQDIDVNCFDTTGIIIASTQKILFEKGVISPMADPLVWWNLTNGEVHRYISEENIGNLSFSSIYQPLLNKKNEVFLYLQVPFFASQNELNQEISNFLVILINIIAFVFLLSGSLAYWISGNISKSFNLIAEKMDRIRLSEHNERIEWAPKDEIGNLVFQYNKMVDQLEDSAKKMARTERELAWREMAKQVAHEIKNPLTPMKLSLQFLQKAIQEKNSDVNQITERVATNLVSQIDHLSKIATEFSQFANLGNYKPELFNLQFTMRDVIQMYEMQENLSVRWHSLSQPLNIYADKTQINRLLTNLFQNASEAGEQQKITEIVIGERLIPGAVVVSFADNGHGIPESLKHNIFMPNFTTKSAGTGLGLSICKAIVENAGGTIWFETETGIGTTFYVRLPLAK
ncbi:MAG: ATP-binding protein [Bacteroidota bacterium]